MMSQADWSPLFFINSEDNRVLVKIAFAAETRFRSFIL